ncbi:Oidioi.mRNA.OKI2018_I69.chr2.g4236.t1.cds [Oikopleura dioica]|uniref:Oidioi.mRNA.OKI2018_I69.chr2.g4236.t1.cds n=1 Tax=Oikopleura dioica TaxID=34765 RepID=A0ABN7SWN8_OIKDI|nr:Oidioi.mRNA.OKI2018_I69.chr2.g4236.t1.cds [Oikopleura dioica]
MFFKNTKKLGEIVTETEDILRHDLIVDKEIKEKESETSVESKRKSSRRSRIFARKFSVCLKYLPSKATDLKCTIERYQRLCEYSCAGNRQENSCLCSNQECSWEKEFEESCFPIETDRNQLQSSHIMRSVVPDFEFPVESIEKINRQDGVYVHAFQFLQFLQRVMYEEGLFTIDEETV